MLVSIWHCCDRKSRAAYAQSFALWQQATTEFICHDHSSRTLLLRSVVDIASITRDYTPRSLCYCLFAPHIWMVLFFTHIPFVVNHTFNARPPERLQQYSPHALPSYNVSTSSISTDVGDIWEAFIATKRIEIFLAPGAAPILMSVLSHSFFISVVTGCQRRFLQQHVTWTQETLISSLSQKVYKMLQAIFSLRRNVCATRLLRCFSKNWKKSGVHQWLPFKKVRNIWCHFSSCRK